MFVGLELYQIYYNLVMCHLTWKASQEKEQRSYLKIDWVTLITADFIDQEASTLSVVILFPLDGELSPRS